MLKVKVRSVSIKTGTNEKGDWVNTRVTGDDDAVFGTFVDGAKAIKAGDLIELEPIIKGKHINFDKWNMLEQVREEKPKDGKTQQDEMSKDDWAERERITRKSIERQVALKSAIELGQIIFSSDEITIISILTTAKLFEEYLEGKTDKLLEAYLKGETIQETKPEPLPEAPEQVREGIEAKEGDIVWADVRTPLNKLNLDKIPAWNKATIIKKLEDIGADISSENVKTSFETLNQEGRQKFADMVKEALEK